MRSRQATTSSSPSGGWALPQDALGRVGLRSGMRFLDVASGSGGLAIPAARLGAEVLAVDLPLALRELVRVIRPGGRALIIAYGPPRHVESLSFFTAAMRVTVPGFTGLPTDPPPLPFQVAGPETLRQAMTAAGLTDVRVEPGVERLQFKSAAQMWDWVTNSNPIAAGLVADLTPHQRTQVQQVLDGMLREHSGGGPGAVLNGQVNVGIGTK